jgi:endoglucanase
MWTIPDYRRGIEMKKSMLSLSCILGMLVLILTACGQATPIVEEPAITIPAEIPGKVIYIPFPVAITVDGKLDDWMDMQSITVNRGPSPSTNPAENGSFTFSVAADATNLYVTMQMPDQNIIAGKHGSEFWNEDSMEFYVNASDNLNATAYGLKIFQVNINAADIGNTDPNALTITGVFSSDAKVSGYVFKTADGWGFEAALDLTKLVEVAHGKEIGFQAQINGATVQDRDVKLIWSKVDTDDTSWEHPNLFGRALFYELGRTDIPLASAVETLPTAEPTAGPIIIPPQISVNQIGYFTQGEKIALVAADVTEPQDWILKDSTGNTVSSGKTTVKGKDANSADNLQIVTFTDFTTTGSGYTLSVGSLTSAPFAISDEIYDQLKNDALSYFYLNRSGIAIEEKYAGEDWARPAGHITDSNVTCFMGKDADENDWPGCNYSLDVSGGWYDAGDFGKYVVNGGISVWTLMNLYERLPDAFPDGSQSIPENANGVSDLLDEARWEMEFLLSMQVPEGQPLAGMAHHKMHDESWAAMPMVPPTEVNNDNANAIVGTGRYLYPPTTAATLNLAATAAQCARIWKEINPAFSERCLVASESAWKAALANPGIYAGNNPGSGGGNYEDGNVADEFYWAASELFITTDKAEYQTCLLGSNQFAKVDAFDWGNTAPLGTISLLSVDNSIPADKLAVLKHSVLVFADSMLKVQDRDGYFALIEGDYPWGSNGLILNNTMLMGVAYNISGDANYLNSMRRSMDYILGRNTLNKSFVSGYGTYPMLHPHHRFWANDPANGYPPPPPGALSGGPNFNPDDPAANNAELMSLSPAERYLDDIESYTTNEVTINWNAPLVWVATFLDWTAK